MYEQHFVETGIAVEVISPNHFGHVSHVGPEVPHLALFKVMPFISDTWGLLSGTPTCPRLMWAGQLGTHLLSMGWDLHMGSSSDKFVLV